jgi:hypothetical protein
MSYWKQIGEPLRANRWARSLDWTAARGMIKAAGPVLLANAERLKTLLKQSNDLLSPLEDPLLTDYGVHEWLSRSREEAYSDWLAWVLRQIKEPRQILQVLDIEDREAALRGILLDPRREVFVAQGHPGHTGRMDLEMAVRGKALIQVEVKLTKADASDVGKNAGYSASAKRYGVSKSHWHRRLLATDGDESVYPGHYRPVTWRHVAIRLRIIAARMVQEDRVSAASGLLGFVSAVEQNLLGFSSAVAGSAFRGEPVPLATGLIDHLEDFLKGGDHNAKS